MTSPVLLAILDGWGLAPPGEGNAVALADTPVYDALVARGPCARLRTSGPDVGLPEGQFGNSEVGHLNLGAGFVVRQDLSRIDAAIAEGALADNPVLVSAMDRARDGGGTLHVAGLLGRGGVHSHDRHLIALVELAAARGVERLRWHAFTDGRDTPPDSAPGFLADVEDALERIGLGRLATLSGRYYAMDRDHRWERTEKAWAALVEGRGRAAPSGQAALRAAYAAGETDEFVTPTVIQDAEGGPEGLIEDGDVLLFSNFRSDRVRQLLAAFTEPDFEGFARRRPRDLCVLTMTQVEEGQRADIAFPPTDVERPLARVLSEAGLRQFHTAETEKYAHVTWFFNGGREAPFPGESRRLVPSPRVATYDLRPEMSAEAVTEGLIARIRAGEDAFLLVNYANADMVGHTGDLDAAIRACEVVDACLGRVLAAVEAAGGAALVTADHGNAERMIDPATGAPHTAHTDNPVPLLLVGGPPGARLRDGRLADVAPTVLDLLGLAPPPAMTGRSLLERGDA